MTAENQAKPPAGRQLGRIRRIIFGSITLTALAVAGVMAVVAAALVLLVLAALGLALIPCGLVAMLFGDAVLTEKGREELRSYIAGREGSRAG